MNVLNSDLKPADERVGLSEAESLDVDVALVGTPPDARAATGGRHTPICFVPGE